MQWRQEKLKYGNNMTRAVEVEKLQVKIFS
jgi:hypothetical protein